jgi:hypothetical protein
MLFASLILGIISVTDVQQHEVHKPDTQMNPPFCFNVGRLGIISVTIHVVYVPKTHRYSPSLIYCGRLVLVDA